MAAADAMDTTPLLRPDHIDRHVAPVVRPVRRAVPRSCIPSTSRHPAPVSAQVWKPPAETDSNAAREPDDIDRYVAVAVRTVTELPVDALAPALDAAGRQERTRVIVPRGDGDDAARQAHDVDRGLPRRVRTVAELPEEVGSPALRGAARS